MRGKSMANSKGAELILWKLSLHFEAVTSASDNGGWIEITVPGVDLSNDTPTVYVRHVGNRIWEVSDCGNAYSHLVIEGAGATCDIETMLSSVARRLGLAYSNRCIHAFCGLDEVPYYVWRVKSAQLISSAAMASLKGATLAELLSRPF